MEKKKKRIIFLVLLVGVLCCLIANCGPVKASWLAAYGKKQFLSSDFEQCMNNLRSCGLDDLNAKVKTEYRYDKEGKILHLKCILYGPMSRFSAN